MTPAAGEPTEFEVGTQLGALEQQVRTAAATATPEQIRATLHLIAKPA